MKVTVKRTTTEMVEIDIQDGYYQLKKNEGFDKFIAVKGDRALFLLLADDPKFLNELSVNFTTSILAGYEIEKQISHKEFTLALQRFGENVVESFIGAV